jgi:hypothetical protein
MAICSHNILNKHPHGGINLLPDSLVVHVKHTVTRTGIKMLLNEKDGHLETG